VRAEAETLVAAQHASELDALRAEYEAKLAAVRADERAVQVARLQQRLVQLARTPGLREKSVGFASEGGDT